MSKILLIGRASDETLNLRRELKRQEIFSVDLATTSTQAIDTITKEMIQLLVFNTEVLTKKKLAITNDLKDLGQDFPVLVLANSIMADALGDLDRSKRTVFLEKPFEIKDLFGVTDKLIAGDDVRQRIFKRFVTNQEGNFSKPPALDHFISVKIRNLSQGGAFFEYEGRPHVHVGDHIYLDIPLQLVQKEYKMKARVVWTSQHGSLGRNGLGVEFIK